jgi:hypothetical protein
MGTKSKKWLSVLVLLALSACKPTIKTTESSVVLEAPTTTELPIKIVNGYEIKAGANLIGAKLYNANLAGADLNGANLIGAKLYNANLAGADLNGANLSGAKLNGINLYGTNLQFAKLQFAELNNATVCGFREPTAQHHNFAVCVDVEGSQSQAHAVDTWSNSVPTLEP